MTRVIIPLLVALTALWGLDAEAASKPTFTLSVVGNRADVVASPRGGIAMTGGGTDVDPAFRWMIDRAGGGDFVVIRATGGDDYNRYMARLGQVDSVATIVFRERRAASEPAVVDALDGAEAIFIAGGDQSDYLRLWKDTPVESSINRAAGRGAVIGGASAGLAVLGEFVYSASRGTVYSREALTRPYGRRMTFSDGFLALPLLDGTITDTHVGERNRLGRLIAFVARMSADRRSDHPRGIGVDEDTALLVDAGGTGRVVGRGRVTLVDPSRAPDRCARGEPLTFRDLSIYRADAGETIDRRSWTGTGGSAAVGNVVKGRLQPLRPAVRP